MTTLTALVSQHPLRLGDQGADVLAMQLALNQAGYRVGQDGDFGPRTEMVLKQFQMQHGLPVDAICGIQTAALLDQPHAQLVKNAQPLLASTGWPHDDTASLIAFYGNPDEAGFEQNLVDVQPPFPLTYDGKPWPHPIKLHHKCAQQFAQAFAKIWEAAGKDPTSPILQRISRFSGSYNNRPVRASSRKSCHAFGAALDCDAENLPMGKRVDISIMPESVVQAFDSVKIFWGNRYVGRPDPMHFQAAHE